MGGACSTYGERRGVYRVLVGKPEGKNHLENRGVNGKILLRLIFRNWDIGTDWIDLVEYRDRWRALLSNIMNHRFS